MLKVYLLMGVFVVLALGILARVVDLQFIERQKWIDKAEKERVYFRKDVATRGNILARDGSVLAMSQPSFRLSIDPKALAFNYEKNPEKFALELDTLSGLLATAFGEDVRDASHYKSLILNSVQRKDRHLYIVKRSLNYSEFKKVKSWPILRNHRNRGGLIGEKITNRRFNPFKNLAKITVGTMRDDTIPLRGIEFAFNHQLRGQDGQVLVQKIAGGIEIPVEDVAEESAIDGADVVTTLDVLLQDVAEAALLRTLKRTRAKYGVAIVMEVQTGEIRALVNLTEGEDSSYFEAYNYAFAEQIQPGSTFKLASYMAAIEDKAVSLDDSIDTGKGFTQFYDKTMTDHEAHGVISYRQGFEYSSNVATSTMIHTLYKDNPGKFIRHLQQFGVLDAVNNQIPGEPAPFVLKPEDRRNWDLTTLPWLSIGYNVKMTPLQILTFYNSIANDGVMMEPRIVREIRRDANTEKFYKPHVLRESICSAQTVAEVKKLLEGVVERGTASNIKSDSYKIAGKTGTAKKVVNGKYQKVYSASFCGYFPAENPRYSCYVLIDEPEGDIYGSSVAAPVFREIADYLFATDLELGRGLDKLKKTDRTSFPLNSAVNQQNAERVYDRLNISTPAEAESKWVRTNPKEKQVEFKPFFIRQGMMPDVTGMSSRDALNMLESLGLNVSLNGSGKVRGQSLLPGTRINKGDYVSLQLR